MLGKSIVVYSTTTRYGNLRGSVDFFRVVKAGRESYIAPPTTLDTASTVRFRMGHRVAAQSSSRGPGSCVSPMCEGDFNGRRTYASVMSRAIGGSTR